MAPISDNPFSALAALRDSLPEGTDSAAGNKDDKAAKVKRGVCRLFYERKGRGGKEATIIQTENLTDDEIASLASDLKKRLGVGGSFRDDEILLQGDRRAQLRAILPTLGFQPKG